MVVRFDYRLAKTDDHSKVSPWIEGGSSPAREADFWNTFDISKHTYNFPNQTVQDDAPPDRTAILETAFETTLDSSERFALMSSVLNEHYRNGVCTGLTATALQAFKDGG